MRRTWGWMMAASLASLASMPILQANTYNFTLLPTSGNVAGPPGSTVGWGYTLNNESAHDWLVTSDLEAGAFLNGSPNSLFDFPDLGPGQSETVQFDSVTGVGLCELTWDVSAPIGFTNTGTFELERPNGGPAIH
jgi:hypothetical protein